MKRIKIIVFVFLAFSNLSLCLASNLHVYLAVQSENVGDHDQVRALAEELKKNHKGGKVDSIEFDLTHVKPEQIKVQIKSDISSRRDEDGLYLLVAVSNYGIDLVKQLSDINQLKIVPMAHQASKEYTELLGRADVCILPRHSVTESFIKIPSHSKTHLIQTVGVLHSLKQSDLIVEYEKNRNSIPKADSYLGVILAGDVPLSDGKMNYFSKKEAEKLAEYIGKEARKHHSMVLILNGPRTGKYDQETGLLNPLAHRSGKIDAVTSLFQNKLQTLIPKQQMALYDFQFGRVSYYKSVLGAIMHSSGKILVPGESTSMVAESAEILPQLVYVYENGAMNSVHFAHVKSEYHAGRIHLLSREFQEYAYKQDVNPTEGQSSIVAREVLKIVTK